MNWAVPRSQIILYLSGKSPVAVRRSVAPASSHLTSSVASTPSARGGEDAAAELSPAERDAGNIRQINFCDHGVGEAGFAHHVGKNLIAPRRDRGQIRFERDSVPLA